MNQTIQELLDRKSIRVFEEKKISPEDKALIIEAAANAPTAGNQQLYTIIDVTNQELKEKLVVTCDNQPFIAEADLVLIFCADCKKWHDGFQSAGCEPRDPGVGDLLLAVSDANIAAQNAVTAAWSLGIGSCYIGDIMENCEEQRKLLNLPKYGCFNVHASLLPHLRGAAPIHREGRHAGRLHAAGSFGFAL